MPTHIPHTRFANPQVNPAAKIEKPEYMAKLSYSPLIGSGYDGSICRYHPSSISSSVLLSLVSKAMRQPCPHLCLQDDGHNHSVDGHSLAEYNTAFESIHQILARWALRRQDVIQARRAIHLMRFFDAILGTLIAAPTKLLPVVKMPLHGRARVKNASPISSPMVKRTRQRPGRIVQQRRRRQTHSKSRGWSL